MIWKLWLTIAAIVVAHTVQSQELDPFRAPNLSPPVAIIGLPIWADVPKTTTFGFTTELANHYRLSQRADHLLILDGETLRVRGYFEVPVGDVWSIGVDVPFYHQSGGVLDDVVDVWHEAFNLPDGARNRRPEGALDFNLADADGGFFTLDDSGSGLGDIQLSVARRFGARSRWVLRGAVKLPTGRVGVLAGSGASDWTLNVLRRHDVDFRGRAAGFFYGAALIEIGQPENVRFPAEDRALAAVLGGGLALGPRSGIKAQIDANSAAYDSPLVELGQTAVQATLGGWLRFNGSGVFEFAISEDLHVSTTPDVVVFFSLSWRLP